MPARILRLFAAGGSRWRLSSTSSQVSLAETLWSRVAVKPGHTGRMKTAISLPDPLFESAEAMAAEMGISRSQLYATAIQEFVQAQKRSGITESLNRVYEKVDQTLVSVSELRSLEQTLHELRSPRNAARLFAALARAVEREPPPRPVETLSEDLGLEKPKSLVASTRRPVSVPQSSADAGAQSSFNDLYFPHGRAASLPAVYLRRLPPTAGGDPEL